MQDVRVAPGNTESASPDPRAGGPWGSRAERAVSPPGCPHGWDHAGQWDTISPMPSIAALAKFV